MKHLIKLLEIKGLHPNVIVTAGMTEKIRPDLIYYTREQGCCDIEDLQAISAHRFVDLMTHELELISVTASLEGGFTHIRGINKDGDVVEALQTATNGSGMITLPRTAKSVESKIIDDIREARLSAQPAA